MVSMPVRETNMFNTANISSETRGVSFPDYTLWARIEQKRVSFISFRRGLLHIAVSFLYSALLIEDHVSTYKK